MKLYKTILLAALCLATAFATAQTPARKLLLVFAIDTPASLTQTQRQAAFKHDSTVLQRRAKVLGVEQVQIWQQQPNQIGIALPDSVDAKNAKALLADNTLLTFHLVDDDPAKNLEAKKRGKIPGYLVFPDSKDSVYGVILVRQKTFLDSRAVVKAETGTAVDGTAAVEIELDQAGRKRFAQITKDNIARRIAIVLYRNGKQSVLTAPVIRSEITGGRIQIAGSMNATEAAAIAYALDSGSYTLPLRFVSSSYGLVPTDAASFGTATRNY